MPWTCDVWLMQSKRAHRRPKKGWTRLAIDLKRAELSANLTEISTALNDCTQRRQRRQKITTKIGRSALHSNKTIKLHPVSFMHLGNSWSCESIWTLSHLRLLVLLQVHLRAWDSAQLDAIWVAAVMSSNYWSIMNFRLCSDSHRTMTEIRHTDAFGKQVNLQNLHGHSYARH